MSSQSHTSRTKCLETSRLHVFTELCDVLAGLVDIAAGVIGSNALVIAVTKDGALFGWGYNGHGNLGLGHINSPVLAPTKIQQNITGIKISKVACGDYHTLVLSDSGQVMVVRITQCIITLLTISIDRYLLLDTMAMDNLEITQQQIQLLSLESLD